jgi:hypothetical protein
MSSAARVKLFDKLASSSSDLGLDNITYDSFEIQIGALLGVP